MQGTKEDKFNSGKKQDIEQANGKNVGNSECKKASQQIAKFLAV